MTFGNFSIRNEICSALQENAFAIPLTICIMLSTFTINNIPDSYFPEIFTA